MLELFLATCCLIGLYNLVGSRGESVAPELIEAVKREATGQTPPVVGPRPGKPASYSMGCGMMCAIPVMLALWWLLK